MMGIPNRVAIVEPRENGGAVDLVMKMASFFFFFFFFLYENLHCTSRVECKDNISSYTTSKNVAWRNCLWNLPSCLLVVLQIMLML